MYSRTHRDLFNEDRYQKSLQNSAAEPTLVKLRCQEYDMFPATIPKF